MFFESLSQSGKRCLLLVLHNKKKLFSLLIVSLFSLVFTFWFIAQERFIYFWDLSTYWNYFIALSTIAATKPLFIPTYVYSSIYFNEYNYLPIVALIPFHFFFGGGRIVYILAIICVSFIPSGYLFATLIEQLYAGASQTKRIIPFIIACLFFCFLPQIYSPIFYGYVDIVGLPIIFIILMLSVKKPCVAYSFRELVSFSFLLALLVLLRRTYSFWVVGFLAALFLEIFLKKGFSWRVRISQAQKVLLVCICSIAWYFLATPFLAMTHLTTNYRYVYSAYRSSNSLFQFVLAVQHFANDFGFLMIGLFLTGVIFAFSQKHLRHVAIVLLTQCICTFLTFSYIQDFSSQHYYLLIPAISIFAVIAIVAIYDHMKVIWHKSLFFLFSVLVMVFNCMSVFVPAVHTYTLGLYGLFPTTTHYPLIRNDLPEIKRLLQVLSTVSSSKNSTIYVLASSYLFNGSIMQNACSSLRVYYTVCKDIVSTYDVDKRDGYPSSLFTANLVVVAYPIQYHLAPSEQKDVGMYASQLLSTGRLGKNRYKKLPDQFTLDSGMKVYMYQKL